MFTSTFKKIAESLSVASARTDSPSEACKQSKHSTHSRQSQVARLYVAAALLLGLINVLEQQHLTSRLVGRYTNEDHAVLWTAASDWMRLRPREPTFYGQPYGVNLEAIPMGLLHGLGVSYGTAFPWALLAMAMGSFWLLAWSSFRRQAWLSGLCAAAAPIVLSTDHWIIVGVIGTGVGRLLAAAGVAWLLASPASLRNIALSVVLLSSAIAFDTATVIIVAPALLWAAFAWLRVPRFWVAGLVGLLPALLWKAFLAWFEQRYPDHALHAGWDSGRGLEQLKDNLQHMDRLFGAHMPELSRHGVLLLWFCGLCLALSVAAWSLRALLTTACFVALLITLMSLGKSLDGSPSLWFPHARMTLAFPLGIWFLGFVVAQSCLLRFRERIPERALHVLAGAVVVLALATSVVRLVSWDQRIGAIEEVGLAKGNMPLKRVEMVYDECALASQAAAEANTNIIFFPYDRTTNYACPALHRGLITAFPDYERRRWVLHALSKRVSDRMIVWGLNPADCSQKRLRRKLTGCRAVGDGHGTLLEFSPEPPLDKLHKLGYSVRPFGAGCHPFTREGCEWWAERYGH